MTEAIGLLSVLYRQPAPVSRKTAHEKRNLFYNNSLKNQQRSFFSVLYAANTGIL